jgi:glutathione S-transferase
MWRVVEMRRNAGQETVMDKLTLISHDLCPYVQRAVIALTEKGVAFDKVYVDLANKPDWFKAMSPLGKVPLLKIGDEVIFESAVILEYLEETQANPLYPRHPLLRAKHRAMIEFGSAVLADIWGVETVTARAQLDAKFAALKEKFARVETMLGDGPWFAGEKFGLVDAVFGPAFRYFDTFDAIVDHGVFVATPKVSRWRDMLAARPSVRDAVVADFGVRLAQFIRNQGGALAEMMPRAAA